MIRYRTRGVWIADVFLGEPFHLDATPGVDVVRYNYWPTRPPGEPGQPSHTRVIDLTRTEEELFSEVQTSSRRAIRLAEKDTLECRIQFPASPELTGAFSDVYDPFARARGLEPADRARLAALAAAGQVEVNQIFDPQATLDDAVLVWHLNVRACRRALMLYSVSQAGADPDRQRRIGRGNRRLHWQEIRSWKSQGLEAYDFGGWYTGSDDRQLLGINRFKEAFGGAVTPTYNSLRPCTLKGSLALRFLSLKRWSRSWLRKAASPDPSAEAES